MSGHDGSSPPCRRAQRHPSSQRPIHCAPTLHVVPRHVCMHVPALSEPRLERQGVRLLSPRATISYGTSPQENRRCGRKCTGSHSLRATPRAAQATGTTSLTPRGGHEEGVPELPRALCQRDVELVSESLGQHDAPPLVTGVPSSAITGQRCFRLPFPLPFPPPANPATKRGARNGPRPRPTNESSRRQPQLLEKRKRNEENACESLPFEPELP